MRHESRADAPPPAPQLQGKNLLLNSSFGRWSWTGGYDSPEYIDCWARDLQQQGFHAEPAFTTAHHGKVSCRIANLTGVSHHLAQAPIRVVDEVHRTIQPVDPRHVRGRVVTASCWVQTDTPHAAKIAIVDGRRTTESAYHSGSGQWERLIVSHQVHPQAPTLGCRVVVDLDATVFVDEITLALGGAPVNLGVSEKEEAAWLSQVFDAPPAARDKPVTPDRAEQVPKPVPGAEFTGVDQLIWQKLQNTAELQGGRFVFLSVASIEPSKERFLRQAGIPFLSFDLPFDPYELRRADLRAGRYDPKQDSHRFGYKANEEVAKQLLQFLLDRRLIPLS